MKIGGAKGEEVKKYKKKNNDENRGKEIKMEGEKKKKEYVTSISFLRCWAVPNEIKASTRNDTSWI